MRILAVAGAPGVGKSTMMQQLLTHLGSHTRQRFGVLDYMQFESVNVLGYYEPGNLFGGTDRLSMSVQDNAIEYLNTLYQRDPHRALAFEGDRLCNGEFIRRAQEVGELRFVVLTCAEKTLVGRRVARSEQAGKEQNAVWLRGRESKVYRLSQDFPSERRGNNSPADSSAIAKDLYDWLMGRTTTPVDETRLF